jgi:hypothetical protein
VNTIIALISSTRVGAASEMDDISFLTRTIDDGQLIILVDGSATCIEQIFNIHNIKPINLR